MDILDKLAQQSLKTISSGYYNVNYALEQKKSLKKTLNERKFSLIGELKYASPSHGILRDPQEDVLTAQVLARYCAGISILTEPRNFLGSLERFVSVRSVVDVPLLMKDFIIAPEQITAAQRIGADAVLLITTLANRGYFDLDEMIDRIHETGRDVVLEVHSRDELEAAIRTEADIIGVNNRDLRTLKTDIAHTLRIMKDTHVPKPVLSESGFSTKTDVMRVKDCVDGILVGTSLMTAENVEEKLEELLVCG